MTFHVDHYSYEKVVSALNVSKSKDPNLQPLILRTCRLSGSKTVPRILTVAPYTLFFAKIYTKIVLKITSTSPNPEYGVFKMDEKYKIISGKRSGSGSDVKGAWSPSSVSAISLNKQGPLIVLTFQNKECLILGVHEASPLEVMAYILCFADNAKKVQITVDEYCNAFINKKAVRISSSSVPGLSSMQFQKRGTDWCLEYPGGPAVQSRL